MKKLLHICVVTCVSCLLMPAAGMAGKGYMGGSGTVTVTEEPAPETDDGDGGLPDTVEGPLNDKMADSGKLFGDLYVILRQQGILLDKKLVPATNFDSETDDRQGFVVVENTATSLDAVIGGEPVLTVIDPPANQEIGESFVPTDLSDYGWYAAETIVGETITYSAAQSPYPAQCVQPIASYERWGDISSKTGLTRNRLPMVITYDATWGRSECAVGKLNAPPTVDQTTGELSFDINAYFIEPGGTWTDKVNGTVTYPDGVLWTDLIGEVSFGRLNIGRAPEAVLQAAFDEAINTINSPDTIAIEIDAAGRLLLTKKVYDELRVDPTTGEPLYLGTVKKAIDSPLENVALYVKLMQDGHLVTPADEREPIDRSKNGGIPIWKMLELEDGPADAALRPTINIAKMNEWGMGDLVVPDDDVVSYYTYYTDVTDDSTGVVTNRILTAVELEDKNDCVDGTYTDSSGVKYPCSEGILTDSSSYKPDPTDLNFTAAFLAAAADKTGHINQDMVVYINSILGINKVVGYSAYNDDGTPADAAIDYSKNPLYFNFRLVSEYSRTVPFSSRGDSGFVTVLQGGPIWTESSVSILGDDDNLGAKMPKSFVDTSWMPEADRIVFEPEPIFDNLKMYAGDNGAPILVNGKIIFDLATENILGFTQQSDDDLSVIRFIHTYQIPGLR